MDYNCFLSMNSKTEILNTETSDESKGALGAHSVDPLYHFHAVSAKKCQIIGWRPLENPGSATGNTQPPDVTESDKSSLW